MTTRSGASLAPAAAAGGGAGDSASAAELSKYKLRSEKLTSNLLACKQVEKDLKGDVTKLRLELEMTRSGLADREREIAELQAMLKQHAAPTVAVSASTTQLKRKSLAIGGGVNPAASKAGVSFAAVSEANKENAGHN